MEKLLITVLVETNDERNDMKMHIYKLYMFSILL